MSAATEITRETVDPAIRITRDRNVIKLVVLRDGEWEVWSRHRSYTAAKSARAAYLKKER